MGQIRHGSATTTHAVRAAIQRSQASLAQLSRELDINPKTVAKWRKRAMVEDMKTGQSVPRSTVRSEGEEAVSVAFRRHMACRIFCARGLFSSLADGRFAEDDGELGFGLGPLAQRTFPFLGRVVEDQV